MINMTLRKLLTGMAIVAYLAAPVPFVMQKYDRGKELSTTLAQEVDKNGNNNGILDLPELQDAYRRMGINSDALISSPYQRLVHSGDPTAENKPFDVRFPTESDLERGIASYGVE
ncbi:hypothetical protein HYW21_01495 [Candidatus Woesearchaeota archaeon]|nr:hypothetical protein [Candidatus Woesearchaeota archaeon]